MKCHVYVGNMASGIALDRKFPTFYDVIFL